MFTPATISDWSRARAEELRAEARGGSAGGRVRRSAPRRVRRAVGTRLVSAGLRMIGGGEVT